MVKREMTVRYILLAVGVFCIGLGVALAKHSDLGVSPVSSVANVLSIRFPFMTVGTWLMLWNFFMIFIQVLILGKDFRPVELLQIPISLLLGLCTDLGMVLVSPIPANHYAVRLLLVFAGVVVIGFGITLMIFSRQVMNVGEALVNVIANATHKNFGTVKLVFDIVCVGLAVVLSLAFFDGQIVGTREGTLLTACSTGFVVRFLTKHLEKPINKMISGENAS